MRPVITAGYARAFLFHQKLAQPLANFSLQQDPLTLASCGYAVEADVGKLITLVLEVQAERALDLVEAFRKRDYINIVELDRAERKRRSRCPACGGKFPREVTYGVTEEVAECLLRVVQKMETARTVILLNRNVDNTRFPDYELPRCVPFDHNALRRAEALGLISTFMDGERLTHFATAKTLALLGGKEPLSPSEVVLSGGEVIEERGSIYLGDVKFRDRARKDSFLREAQDAVNALPKKVVDFVCSGQMTLG